MLIADKFLTNGMAVFNGMPPVTQVERGVSKMLWPTILVT